MKLNIEHIDNPCFGNIAVNSKECNKLFEDNCFSKKHKGTRKGATGMDFKNYTSRIVSVNDCDYFQEPSADSKQGTKFSVVDGEMQQKLMLLKQSFLNLTIKGFTFLME